MSSAIESPVTLEIKEISYPQTHLNSILICQIKSEGLQFKNYVYDNVPFIASIQNFWVNGGIHYTEQQLEEQHLVKKITKKIFKLCHIAGKEAQALSSNDIYNHFKEIGAYKDNILSKEIDLFQNHLLHSNDDIWDVSYLSDDDTSNLIGEDNE